MHRPLLVLLVAGCNLNPKPSDDTGTVGDDTGGGGGALTIKDVRGGAAADGDVITLEGLVVTSPITRDGEGFFVQDQDGGARSGLYVWSQAGMDPYVAAQGDEVTITGTISEFFGWTELTINTMDQVEITGSGTIPAAADLGDGAGVNWDDYESMPVVMSGQTVESVNAYNTGLLAPSGIGLDDGFLFLDFGCGGTYTSLTGIIFYSYEAYSINPRAEGDIGEYTGGGNSAATIAEIQQGTACGTLDLTGIVATTDGVEADDGSVSFFAQDAGGGEYSGIVVFLPGGGVTVAEGDVIDVQGSSSEYYDLTELYVSDAATFAVTGSAEPTATALSAAPADWEVYEGALVTLSDVGITSDIDDYGQVSTSYGLFIDNGLFNYQAANGDTFASVTGVVTYTFGEWKLWPRRESDIAR